MGKRIPIAFGALAILLGLAIYTAIDTWTGMAGTSMSVHGWIALVLCAIVTVALGVGLMFLVFYSNRHGYDDSDKRPD